MKSGANEALFALVMLAVWGVVLTTLYKRNRERIDGIPVVGVVLAAIAGFFAGLFEKSEPQPQQQGHVYPPQPMYGYPPQPYTVPVQPMAQQPVYGYPPVPPQLDADGNIYQTVNLTEEQLAETIARARAAGYQVETQADGTLLVREQSHSVPVQPQPTTTPQPTPVADDLDDLFDKKLDEG
ncbi:hypothetical protein [Mycolicibacterium fallax]|uniref:Uncharacterized protein n=1 Tax=Mycolicibacterium fallax TaxID=1793 RepID=A0A1X1R7S5_MYCFA|nr:hypothetical protein [Mycolicibacterium fallax]ORV00976.1 hypothetical protein AWC04_14990 [Mycolicibacterium fallax]BBZ00531.1 hypothetical protein MFAL_39970 [Mycolicibacterium fallax]